MKHSSQTLAEIEEQHPRQTSETSEKSSYKPDAFSKFLVLEGVNHWLFRFGFASIFLVNAVYAIMDPASFTSMLEENAIASLIGHYDFMVKVALVNDLLLGIFIISGYRKRIVYGWAGAWLLLVAGLKMMNLIF